MTSIARKLLKNSTYPIIKDSQKPKNLFELLNVFPNYGVGLKVVRVFSCINLKKNFFEIHS